MQLVIAQKCPQMHLLHSAGKLADLGLLLLILLEPLLVAPLRLLHIKAVIAGIKLRFSLVQGNDAVHAAVKEIAVMGDGKHRALEAGHIVLQPLHRVQIQVVRRLVQQEDVRILQDQAAQIDPGLFAAGQSGEFPLAHLPRPLHTLLMRTSRS